MKTTVEISDPLFQRAREIARRRRITLRDLIEAALRRVVEEDGATRPFKLKKASFGGQGLQPGVAEGSWEQIRDMIYEGRGS